MKALKEALDIGDTMLIERQAHSLKSASANIGADLMRGKALQTELFAKDNNLNKVQSVYKGLENEFERVLQKLKEQ